MAICSVKHGAIDSNLHYTGEELILPKTHSVCDCNLTCTYFVTCETRCNQLTPTCIILGRSWFFSQHIRSTLALIFVLLAILSALYLHCCAETLGCILHSYITPVPILPSVMAYKHCSADIFSLQHFTLISIIQHFWPLTNLSCTQNHIFVLISFSPKNQLWSHFTPRNHIADIFSPHEPKCGQTRTTSCLSSHLI